MPSRTAAQGLIVVTTLVALASTYFLFQDGTGIRSVQDFRMRSSLDGYSEAVVVRSADRFAAEGFAHNVGLPDPSGPRFADMGINGPSGSQSGDPVYHGDPPGPHWIAAVGFRIWGGSHLGRTRLAAVIASIAAAIVFARALARTLGNARALFVFAACAACPMFTNMSDSLYYYGYAQALLLVQIAILLDLFARPEPGPAPKVGRRLAALGLIGLVQGFLSYPYGGVVALAAVPVALLATADDRPIAYRLLIAAVAVPAVGFAAAHLIHFGQSVVYFGSVREALDEYAFRGRKTYWVGREYPTYQSHLSKVLLGFRLATVALLRRTHQFAPASIAITGLVAAALVIRRATATTWPRWHCEVVSRPTGRRLLGLLIAFAAGASWIVLKPNHAIAHFAVVGRTFFLPYFGAALFLAMTVRLRGQRLRRPVPGLAATQAAP